jgi:hypothetical protein
MDVLKVMGEGSCILILSVRAGWLHGKLMFLLLLIHTRLFIYFLCLPHPTRLLALSAPKLIFLIVRRDTLFAMLSVLNPGGIERR